MSDRSPDPNHPPAPPCHLVTLSPCHPVTDKRVPSDVPFFVGLALLGGAYVVLIAGMLLADLSYTSPGHLVGALRSREIRYAIWLSLLSCGITTILSLWAAVPLGYLLSRFDFP